MKKQLGFQASDSPGLAQLIMPILKAEATHFQLQHFLVQSISEPSVSWQKAHFMFEKHPPSDNPTLGTTLPRSFTRPWRWRARGNCGQALDFELPKERTFIWLVVLLTFVMVHSSWDILGWHTNEWLIIQKNVQMASNRESAMDVEHILGWNEIQWSYHHLRSYTSVSSSGSAVNQVSPPLNFKFISTLGSEQSEQWEHQCQIMLQKWSNLNLNFKHISNSELPYFNL